MKIWTKYTLMALWLSMANVACSSDSSEKVTQTQTHEPPPRYVATDDLDGVVARGSVRVLVYGVGETHLARDGSPAQRDRELAEAVAKTLGVDLHVILVENYADLIPMLLDGRGDIVAAQMTVTDARKKQVAFTRPTRSVDEVLVGKRGGAKLPRTLAELAGREVHVRQSSSYAQTLDGLLTETGEPLGVRIVGVEESASTESIVYELSRGELGLTVADSNILDMMEGYNQGFFDCSKKRKEWNVVYF